MANYIKKIKLPNIDEPFIIRDEEAIHSIADIEGLGLKGAFIFKGVVDSVADLPESGNEVGWVYHVIADDSEYVWTTLNEWEEFGKHIIVDHIHNYATNVTVSGTASESTVSGTATVSGTNSESSVDATGSINVPTVEKTSKYVKANSSITNVAVAGDGSAAAITGFANHTTAEAITELNTATINNPTVSSVSATKINSFGTAANWGASVNDEGVLSFDWTPNTIASGEDVNASSVSVVAVSVATDAKSTASAITALGQATTADVLTGVKVETQPTISVSLAEGTQDDGIYTGDVVTVDTENVEISVHGTAEAQEWTQYGDGSISGTAAGQAYSTTVTVSGSTDTPIENV